MEFPIGTIILWENEVIPANWQACDGTNGVLNLLGLMTRGATGDEDLLLVDGYATHKHSNPNTGERSAHSHGGSTAYIVPKSTSINVNVGSGATASASGSHGHPDPTLYITSRDSHSHTTPNTDNESTIPEHIYRVFIIKVA